MRKGDGFFVIKAMMELTGSKNGKELGEKIGYSRQEICRVRCNRIEVRKFMILKMLEITDMPYSELIKRLGMA